MSVRFLARQVLADLSRVSNPLAVLLFCAFTNLAVAGSFRLERVVEGLTNPTCMTQAPGDSNALYIAENVTPTSLLGRILRHDLVTHSNSVFLNLSTLVGANAFNGLNQFAFHPDYQTNGKFYVTYQYRIGANPRITRLAEYRLISGVPVAQRILLEQNVENGHVIDMPFFKPGGDPNHLYVTIGDGGPEAGSSGYTVNRAQDLGTTYGKLLRVDVADGLDAYPADARKNFGIPAINTSATNPPGRLGEVIASGFRHPWRASFDPLTGDLYIGDNGFHTAEEVDFMKEPVFHPVSASIPDHGWPAFEGIFNPVPSANAFVQSLPTNTGSIFPIICRTAAVLDPGVDVTGDGIPDATGDGDDSVICGHVYRGPIAGLYGKYIYADWQAQRVYQCEFDRTTPVSSFHGNNVTGFTNVTALLESTLPGAVLNSIVSFYADAKGNLFLVDYTSGEIFEIVPVPANDNFTNAFALDGTSVSTNGSTVGATREFGEPAHAGNTNTPSVWFRWTAANNGIATITLSNRSGALFDTVLAIYTGSAFGGLSAVAQHHGGIGGSTVSCFVSAGQTCRIAISGWAGTRGDFELGLRHAAAPTLVQAGFGSGQFHFVVAGSPGASYVVDASTNLIDWAPITTNVAIFTNYDPWFTNYPQRFYRAKASP